MRCKDCEENFDVIFNNVPWLTVGYCPFCGGEKVDFSDADPVLEEGETGVRNQSVNQ